jgi:hypothetical protein
MHESTVKETRLSLPNLALLVGTRVALGVGLGLLIAGYLSRGARKGLGAALLGLGAVSTIPLALKIVAGREDAGGVPGETMASDRGLAKPYMPNESADKDRTPANQNFLKKHSPSPNNPNDPGHKP